MNILIIILSCISIILFIAFLVILIKFKKLDNEYNSYKREIYRNSNKINMVEYYLRVYKDMIEILLASGGDWNITTKIRHGIETIIIIFWLSWVVWKFIIC